MSPRITRSRSRQPQHEQEPEHASDSTSPDIDRLTALLSSRTPPTSIQLPSSIPKGLNKAAFELVKLKQRKLFAPSNNINSFIRECQQSSTLDSARLVQAAAATLVFVQAEAGTAVCISPSGLLLTCAHCVAEDEASFDPQANHWLLTVSARLIRAMCIAWCAKRDLALLQITGVSDPWSPTTTPVQAAEALTEWPYIELACAPPSRSTPLICIGHPGSEDLETSQGGVQTGYDVLHVSEGRFRGLAKGQDPLDNSEIGALKHDCWTYWGHSGAPLIDRRDGRLVGLHSSWDDETGMRRGVAWVAIWSFLMEHVLQSEK